MKKKSKAIIWPFIISLISLFCAFWIGGVVPLFVPLFSFLTVLFLFVGIVKNAKNKSKNKNDKK